MIRRDSTLEDLEEFAEQLNGPLGAVYRATGVILEQRMRERKLTWFDLDDDQLVDMFLIAFQEAAPGAYPHHDRATVEDAVRIMAETVKMELAANVDGSEASN
ncbi:hypothetical protein [uncultured Paracoccus sp.]|uniref:hypothetical protein n=1 Tax=uncultured Paracoccus sp. TaxID=189685 RepID=UPI0025DCE7C8|nr:hypothetical protein [uncultured Paracoccus sp.]